MNYRKAQSLLLAVWILGLVTGCGVLVYIQQTSDAFGGIAWPIGSFVEELAPMLGLMAAAYFGGGGATTKTSERHTVVIAAALSALYLAGLIAAYLIAADVDPPRTPRQELASLNDWWVGTLYGLSGLGIGYFFAQANADN